MEMIAMGSGDHCDVTVIHDIQVRLAQTLTVDGLTATRAAEVFAALGDPSRVRLVSALLGGELCVCDLAAVLGMSQSAVSHQLRLLRTLHLVTPRREGRIVYYTIADDHVAQLFSQGMSHVAHTLPIREPGDH
jgi:DNA-binding transcriptional ArsR family regulator